MICKRICGGILIGFIGTALFTLLVAILLMIAAVANAY